MYKNLSLKSWDIAPPEGWYYFQVSTRLKIEGKDSIELIKRVLAHRQYKKLDRCSGPEVMEDVESQIIDRLKGNEHYCTDKQVNHVGNGRQGAV